MDRLPAWADVVLVPLVSLFLAAAISALVILGIGQDPVAALNTMVTGALGSAYGWGYTLYYATSFIFTGLAVTVAFHAGLFNIGGEGQAQIGGLGVALVCLALPWPHWTLALLFATLGAALFGAAWAAIPAWLQARRGSHIVITTIMFNYIAAALIVYLLVDVLRPAGQMDPATARFPEGAKLPTLNMIPGFDIVFTRGVPANVTLFIALGMAVVVWLLLWRTRLGYQIRAFGKSEPAARYAGIRPVFIIMAAMAMSGALAGMMSINNVMGEAERAKFEQDRKAILAQQGDYRVRFDFIETVGFTADYRVREPDRSGGYEVVRVIEDTGRRIVLQHILVSEHEGKPHITKHWRQDWEYEPAKVLVYSDRNAWTWEDVPEKMRRGRWSQTVWQVDDSPRYAGWGQFEEQGGLRRWRSNWTWRPLARRDAAGAVYDQPVADVMLCRRFLADARHFRFGEARVVIEFQVGDCGLNKDRF